MREIAAIAVRDGSEDVFSIAKTLRADLGDAGKVFADSTRYPWNLRSDLYENKSADKNSSLHLVVRLCEESGCNKFRSHRRSKPALPPAVGYCTCAIESFSALPLAVS